MHIPINELVTSPTAVFLFLAILAFLARVAVLVYFPYVVYFKGLPRDVETLASVIAFVFDSPNSFNQNMPRVDPLPRLMGLRAHGSESRVLPAARPRQWNCNGKCEQWPQHRHGGGKWLR